MTVTEEEAATMSWSCWRCRRVWTRLITTDTVEMRNTAAAGEEREGGGGRRERMRREEGERRGRGRERVCRR